MVNKKFGIDRRNNATRIFRIKKTSSELGIFDVANWRHFDDSFRIIANEVEGYGVNATCRNIGIKTKISSVELHLLPNAFAAARQAAG